MKATAQNKKKQFNTFQVEQKTEIYEKLFYGMESVIFIILSFYAGFEFHNTKSLLWLCLFLGILVGKFKWETIKKITKRMMI